AAALAAVWIAATGCEADLGHYDPEEALRTYRLIESELRAELRISLGRAITNEPHPATRNTMISMLEHLEELEAAAVAPRPARRRRRREPAQSQAGRRPQCEGDEPGARGTRARATGLAAFSAGACGRMSAVEVPRDRHLSLGRSRHRRSAGRRELRPQLADRPARLRELLDDRHPGLLELGD